MKSVIAKNIKKIIDKKGFKQNAVAKQAGYTEQTFSNLLNNRKLITDEDIIRISKTLDVTPNTLFGINDDQKAS